MIKIGSDSSRRRKSEDKDRRGDAGSAKLNALFRECDAERIRSGGEERLRDRHAAVTVRVRLHGREDAHTRPHAAADSDAIRSNSGEVDLGNGRAGSKRLHGVSRGAVTHVGFDVDQSFTG